MRTISSNLAVQSLSLRRGARTLIDALDLTLEAGEVLGILGANGAGKSTLLNVLAGLAAPEQGCVTLDGQALDTVPPLTRAHYIGLLPQGDEGGFFGSVNDFIALGRYPFGDAPGNLASQLASWELVELAQRPLDTLSGGERQRARLAQLAVQAPRIALLDEPLTHLDPAHQARLLAWARSEADAGHTVVLTLHDPNWAACQCDRLLFLHGDGRWQLGGTAELLTPDSLEALYGAGTAALWRRQA
ncbi:MAG TPA: ABC transporter ATP-binding protein [Thiobacillus sp.]|nr:MAG: hemin ABC transporter ATP-binding protein [Hydrogenophilales bacterium 28-61-11]OYZ58818.1 MAG: hemin ABC transporter ATP-binding protein [Hydrogenophilales bacterium 16-61-112]OZA50896.1 MAG: hemin ABC transporter ATP-binding protein [Hydrogenophilales bacterium 17-61-76]HQT30145.1 ABC transporter ATP-binding protein [Thiobacillus sp.]HQT69284.1 ABC transporter ATP-binding protein [Thiobacillus sp.]